MVKLFNRKAVPVGTLMPPGQIKAGDRVKVGRDLMMTVRHTWQTDNWVYIETAELYFPLMLEPCSTVTVEQARRAES